MPSREQLIFAVPTSPLLVIILACGYDEAAIRAELSRCHESKVSSRELTPRKASTGNIRIEA